MTTYYLPYDLRQGTQFTNGAYTIFENHGLHGFRGVYTATLESPYASLSLGTLVRGEKYRITYTVTINSGNTTTRASIRFTDSISTSLQTETIVSNTGSGTFTKVVTASATADASLVMQHFGSSDCDATFSNISVTPLTNIGPSKAELGRNTISAISSSPFTGAQQVYAHRGQYWDLSLEIPPMPVQAARVWSNFFTKLNGRENAFYYRPIRQERPAGSLPTSWNSSLTLEAFTNDTAATRDFDTFGSANEAGATVGSDGTGDGEAFNQLMLARITEPIESKDVLKVDCTVTVNSGSLTFLTAYLFKHTTTATTTASMTEVGVHVLAAPSGNITFELYAGSVDAEMYVVLGVPETDTCNVTISNTVVSVVQRRGKASGAQTSQSTSVDIKNLPETNGTGILDIGDFMEFNGQLLQIDPDTSPDVTGLQGMKIWPYLRSQADANEPAIFHHPRGIFRLESTSFSLEQVAPGIVAGFTIRAREVL